jgi:hypothetical protein
MGGSPMMTTSIFIIVAVFLAFLLLLKTWKEDGEEQARVEAADRARPKSRDALQPQELVFRIFSRQDREFIFLMRSPGLQRMYQRERRKVALHWVRQTSREVSRIMRTHRLSSRQSHNLNVATEANLLIQFLKLQFLCGLLVLLIRIFGPHALQDLATYAGELYQRIGRALPPASVENCVAPSGNSATP